MTKLFQVRFFSLFSKGNINVFPLKIKRNFETFSNSLNMNELKCNKHLPTTSEDFKRTNEKIYINAFVVKLLCHVHLCDPMDYTARQASLSITSSQSLLKLMSIKLVMPSNHLILCLSLLLPSIFTSIGVFSSESVLHIRWPNYWSFSFSISPSSEYSGLISLRMDWFDLLAVQGTLKSLQHHSSKASVLRRSAFFMVQLAHLYRTTGKTIALTIQIFVGKVMSLHVNTLLNIQK